MTILVLAGLPMAFAVGLASLLVVSLKMGVVGLNIVATSTMGTMQSTILLAIPLFMLMANLLQKSGIADDLYDLMYKSLGRMRGGLGVGTILICTIFSAMSGVSAAATVSMGLIALPSMLKRGYDKHLSMGAIMAGGALGPLMPPSVSCIVYALVSGVSVGQLFAGSIFPALLLSALFIIYIVGATQISPNLGPPIPRAEWVSRREILKKLTALVMPALIIAGIFGSMFSGLATPTEASAIGAFGAILSVTIRRRLTWRLVWECCTETLRLTSMVMWLIVTATWFGNVYAAIGGPEFVGQLIGYLGSDRWVILAGIVFILVILACFMDVSAIILLGVPVLNPIIRSLGFDPLWFGVLFIMIMETGYLTPPFGMNLFYMRAIVPAGITMLDIYRSVGMFVTLQITGVLICVIFPDIITYLPRIIFSD